MLILPLDRGQIHFKEGKGSLKRGLANSKFDVLGARRYSPLLTCVSSRSDQMDTAALLGHLTGISITTVPGVYPKDINRVALPLGDYSPNEAGVLGAWRAHLNVMREIVQRNLSTALIFEADADWDVSFKDQLSRMAENMPSGDEEAPYGLDWEMIWLGVSGNAWDRSLLKPATALWKDDSLPTVDAMAGFVKETYAAYGIQGDGWRIMAPAHSEYFAVYYSLALPLANIAFARLSSHRSPSLILNCHPSHCLHSSLRCHLCRRLSHTVRARL